MHIFQFSNYLFVHEYYSELKIKKLEMAQTKLSKNVNNNSNFLSNDTASTSKFFQYVAMPIRSLKEHQKEDTKTTFP